MNRITRLLAIVLILLLLTAAWIWWNQPKKVDMATYVPADSLVFVESNSLAEIAGAIMDTEAWRKLGPFIGLKTEARRNNWLTSWLRVTGIGSTQSVIIARSQLALVMLDLKTTNVEGTSKPVAALVVETHTSTARIKPTIEQLVGDFAQRAYGKPSIERVTKSEGEFVKWVSPDGNRQLIVSIDGSVAIIGNSEQAVVACLAVRRGQKPSLSTLPSLTAMRGRIRAGDALAFGYVSSTGVARLLPEFAPSYLNLINPLLEIVNHCISLSAPRIFADVGWSAHAFAGGIEDNYAILLQPDTLSRLRPAFASKSMRQHEAAWQFLPPETASVSAYNFTAPYAVWEAMNAAIASEQRDVLCAIGFRELSKKSLIPYYGIDDPEAFLRALKPALFTAKLDADSTRPVIIAGVVDQGALKQFVSRTFGKKLLTEKVAGQEITVSEDGQAAASFVDGYFLLGPPEDIRRCLSGAVKRKTDGTGAAGGWATLTEKTASGVASDVVTYAQDRERVRGLITALMKFRGRDSVAGSSEDVERIIESLPYAITETKLEDYGLERRTRSPLGQFSFFVSLLSPEQAH